MRKLNPQALNQLLTQIVTSINTMHTQNIWLLGLTSTWAHNRLVLWAFGFPSVGGPMLGKPKYTSISSRLSFFLTESLLYSLSLSKCLLSFPSALPRIANPFSSLSSPIYRLGWVEELWLLLPLSANGGPTPSSQSGCFIGIVGVALELIPTSAICSVVMLLNTRPGSWAQCASR